MMFLMWFSGYPNQEIVWKLAVSGPYHFSATTTTLLTTTCHECIVVFFRFSHLTFRMFESASFHVSCDFRKYVEPLLKSNRVFKDYGTEPPIFTLWQWHWRMNKTCSLKWRIFEMLHRHKTDIGQTGQTIYSPASSNLHWNIQIRTLNVIDLLDIVRGYSDLWRLVTLQNVNQLEPHEY